MSDRDPQRMLRALRAIRTLPQPDLDKFALLQRSQHEVLIAAYLRAACTLLGRDAAMSVMERTHSWNEWHEAVCKVINEAMLYREQPQIVLTIGVAGALLPGVYPHASLIGFKTLEDVLIIAQRELTLFKRERARRRLHIRELIARVAVWVGPRGELRRDADLPAEERQKLAEAGWRDTWGAQFSYQPARDVLELVEAVLPVVWQVSGDAVLVAPRLDALP
jgi:hypothetical protein